MPDAKSVINLGLGKIAASRVVNLDPPKSPLERHCADGYPVWRDSELEIRTWYFALSNAALTLSESTGVDIGDGRKYRYGVPNDMLRPLQNKRTEWVQRGKFIYSSANELTIEYIARRPESDFPASFINVLACRVACECVEFATQSNTKDDTASAKYAKAVNEASRSNAFVVGPVDIRVDDANDEWLIARVNPGVTE